MMKIPFNEPMFMGWFGHDYIIPGCHNCRGILDYVYHTWWKCRRCGSWFSRG